MTAASAGMDRLRRGWTNFRAAIVRWRRRRQASPGWSVAVGGAVALVALPILTIIIMALTGGMGSWPHLAGTVLPRAIGDTLLLMFGTGVITLATGTGAAWLVTMYRFPGREILDRLLVLPLAVPTYIVAYCYVDLLDYAGPVQTWLRSVMGWRSAGDYWFPDVRSTFGGVAILSSVLYPYVYLAARASFVQQSVCTLEVARTLGRTPLGAFVSVGLPLARPALAAGVALVLMEVLNDLGAVQHLGITTLSAAIHATWQQRGSLAGATQIALVALALVAALFWVERRLRGEGRFNHTTGRYRSIPFAELRGWRAAAAFTLCLLPVLLGLVIPVLVLVLQAVDHRAEAANLAFWQAAWSSVTLSAVAALAACTLALVLAYARRAAGNGFVRPAVRVAGLGYALPGTVLALGLLIPLAAFDNAIDAAMRATLGLSTGLMLTGSIAALVMAYVVRFLAVSLGAVEAGLERVSPSLDAAARTLGASALATLRRVHLPLLVPTLASAALLVFVDVMKELPATLLMRPFGLETLAVHVYSLASQEQLETASVGALAIVLVGLLPVLLLHQAVAAGRSGH